MEFDTKPVPSQHEHRTFRLLWHFGHITFATILMSSTAKLKFHLYCHHTPIPLQ